MERNSLVGLIVIATLLVIIIILAICLFKRSSKSKVETNAASSTGVTRMSAVKPEPIPQNLTTQDNTTIIDLDDAPESQIRALGEKNDLEVLSATRKKQLEDIN